MCRLYASPYIHKSEIILVSFLVMKSLKRAIKKNIIMRIV